MERPMIPHATAVRLHLAACRTRGLDWAKAWTTRPQPSAVEMPWPEEARQWFRDGFLRRSVSGVAGDVSAIAERDGEVDGGERVPRLPSSVERRCGWGGTRCEEAGTPWLCTEHAAVIDAIVPMCRLHACIRDSVEHGYCARHQAEAVSNRRGAIRKAAA